MVGKTHLVIPDSHAHPDYHNKRFDWLGKLILDVKPDVVINIGDMADMPSLCSYDYGTKGFEGRRYKKDVASVIDANERMWYPMRNAKKRQPRKVFTLGNHENRITRAVEKDAKLDGVLGLEDLELEAFGWEVRPFLEIVMIDGVAYTHYFTSGVMGRPIGGMHPAYSLITKQYQSCTQGHSHTRDFCHRTRADGVDILGLSVGCYIDQRMDWAGPANDLWWSGVVLKTEVENGMYDHQWISMKTIKETYG